MEFDKNYVCKIQFDKKTAWKKPKKKFLNKRRKTWFLIYIRP